jgi:glyoxylase-like metal-dependent hydrolase (beta-lactamase superfamily II)
MSAGHVGRDELPPGKAVEVSDGIFAFLRAVLERGRLGRDTTRPAVRVYSDEITVNIDDLICQVKYAGKPAHTTNDSYVWIPDRKVLISGDLLLTEELHSCSRVWYAARYQSLRSGSNHWAHRSSSPTMAQ